MSIHLTDPSVLMALEKLAVMICVTSAHLALQLYFIYMAAMEDFQPENSDGMKNPSSDPVLYNRCSQLLQDVERSFIYGSVVDKPQNDLQVQSGHRKQQSTGNYHNIRDSIHYIAENKVLSCAIDKIGSNDKGTGTGIAENGVLLSGPLLYKRIERKSMFQPKIWKPRYFTIRNRVLHCYHDAEYTELLRALPLQDCEVCIEAGSSKYEHYFEVVSTLMDMKFLLRAEDADQFRKWTTALKW